MTSGRSLSLSPLALSLTLHSTLFPSMCKVIWDTHTLHQHRKTMLLQLHWHMTAELYCAKAFVNILQFQKMCSGKRAEGEGAQYDFVKMFCNIKEQTPYMECQDTWKGFIECDVLFPALYLL